MVIRKASVFGFYRRRRPIYFGVGKTTGSAIFLFFFRCVCLIYLSQMGNEKIKNFFRRCNISPAPVGLSFAGRGIPFLCTLTRAKAFQRSVRANIQYFSMVFASGKEIALQMELIKYGKENQYNCNFTSDRNGHSVHFISENRSRRISFACSFIRNNYIPCRNAPADRTCVSLRNAE